MDRGHKVTLGPEVEAVEAEVGIEMLDILRGIRVGIEMLGTAPQAEADGREIFLRAGGETTREYRVLGTTMLELLLMRHLGLIR